MTELLNVVLLGFLALTAIAAIRLRDLFAVVMMFTIFSLLSASIFVVLGAVDVAFTEAAVGAGISTVLMLETLSLTTRRERPPAHRRLLPLLVVSVTGAALIYGTFDMPHFGDPNAPIHQHVVTRYIEQSPQEIGIPNVVTEVLASYRGFDTLGELTVILTAGVGVIALNWKPGAAPREARPLRQNPLLRVVSKLIIPLILLFALYVQFHGDYGPGGGFQAGVIFASGFILYAMVFGTQAAREVIPPWTWRPLAAAGLFLFMGVGFVSLLFGKPYLDYDVLATNPLAGQHIGVFLVELGIGITVAAVMIIVFLAFAGRRD